MWLSKRLMIFNLFSFKKHQLFCLDAQRLFPVIYSTYLNIGCSGFRFSGIRCILSVCSLKCFFISGKLSWISFGYCFTLVFFRFSYYLLRIPVHLSLSILSSQSSSLCAHPSNCVHIRFDPWRSTLFPEVQVLWSALGVWMS